MNIKTLASSSAGNCFIVEDGKTRLLIEAGIPYKKLLQGIGFGLSSVDGCLLSHAHKDHSHAIKDLIHAGINCYMSAGTAAELNLSGYRVKAMPALKPFAIGTFKVIPFEVKHDCQEPFGYLLKSTELGESLLFITDSYYVPNQFKHVDYFMVECNYITERLMNSEHTPHELKKRLLTSHMSLETCLQFLKAQDLLRCKRIYLTHLSAERGDAEIMRREVMRATGCQTTIAGESED